MPLLDYYSPLPPDVKCTEEMVEEFEADMAAHVRRVRNGYDPAPSAHMLIAWLMGRSRMHAEQEARLKAESEAALAMFNSFSKG